MDLFVYLALLFPLLGFLSLMLLSTHIGRKAAGIVGCATILLSFLCFTTLLYQYRDPIEVTLYNWLSLPSIHVDMSFYVDSLSLLMALIITGVGFLIHLYSIGYTDHETDYARYFSCMNLFVFAMLLLVLASNLLLLFIGWEGVGLASYLLIGFWYSRPSAAKAATKAFVVNRVGDLGFLLGLLFTFYLFGTSDIQKVSDLATANFNVGAPLITIMTLLYFVGAIGKSAQLPLHVWLPDAMEGPTPVSALIHAATMVTAGVYLVVRMHEVFLLAPLTLYVVGAVGGATALFAALCALSQTDLKRVLAYSTVSQLGLMFLACGVGAFYAAMFHLTTHAFVKALLFLSAGNVVHMMHGTTEMEKMGGLAKIFKKTHWLFLIGVLAMSGIPPLSAFFSKELILEEEHAAGYHFLFYVALFASILTAFYLTRAYFLTFTGKTRVEKHTAVEAPRVMLLPVSVLAFLSIVGGFLGFAVHHLSPLERFLKKSDVTLPIGASNLDFLLTPETLLAIAGAVIGVGSAAFIYSRYAERIGKTNLVLKHGFYIDFIYKWLFLYPLRGISRWIGEYIEPHIMDGSVSGSVHATDALARKLQQMQSGQIRSYAAWMVLGTALLMIGMLFIV